MAKSEFEYHLQTHEEHAQILSGVHTSMWGPYMLLSHIISYHNEIHVILVFYF